jgi:hypothetical protein
MTWTLDSSGTKTATVAGTCTISIATPAVTAEIGNLSGGRDANGMIELVHGLISELTLERAATPRS